MRPVVKVGIPDETVLLAAELLADTPLSVVLGEVPPVPGVDADAVLTTVRSVLVGATLVGPALAAQDAEVGNVTPTLRTRQQPILSRIKGVYWISERQYTL